MQPNFPRSRPLALAVAAAMTSLLGGCFGDWIRPTSNPPSMSG